MNRDEFEAWYISKFLNVMSNAQAAVIKLRNDFGGYDDHHMDGAWEAFKRQQMSTEITVRVSAAQAFVFVTSLMSVTGLLYFICFSQDFYNFVMMFSE